MEREHFVFVDTSGLLAFMDGSVVEFIKTQGHVSQLDLRELEKAVEQIKAACDYMKRDDVYTLPEVTEEIKNGKTIVNRRVKSIWFPEPEGYRGNEPFDYRYMLKRKVAVVSVQKGFERLAKLSKKAELKELQTDLRPMQVVCALVSSYAQSKIDYSAIRYGKHVNKGGMQGGASGHEHPPWMSLYEHLAGIPDNFLTNPDGILLTDEALVAAALTLSRFKRTPACILTRDSDISQILNDVISYAAAIDERVAGNGGVKLSSVLAASPVRVYFVRGKGQVELAADSSKPILHRWTNAMAGNAPIEMAECIAEYAGQLAM